MANSGIKRLQQDLKQLKQEPIMGANAEPFDNDLTTWYGLVVGTEGSSLSGIPIRFCLEFPNDYPNKPPSAYFETYIEYRNGAIIHDAKGRIQVCLNIFGNFSAYHSEWGTTSEGWSPSYTVSTILISIQAMMMSDMLSDSLSAIRRMTDAALNFHCEKTGHDGSDSSKWFPQVITDAEKVREIFKNSQKENPEQTILDIFYICYANGQRTGANSVLGYGIHIENANSGMLSSPCEYLSLDSFNNGNVRRSSTNLPFEYWLPILIRGEDWDTGRKIKVGFLDHIEKLCTGIKYQGGNVMRNKVFKICSSLMNGLVVQIMNNGDNVSANDKFINGYFAIYRLLCQYAKDCFEDKLTKLADNSLSEFKNNPQYRVKSKVANLGEFLIYLTISSQFQWADIAESFLQECDARNVFWYVKGNARNPPKCPELSNLKMSSGERCKKVFDCTSVSRNLVMFQVRFANVARNLRESGVLEMDFDSDARYGLAPEVLRAELKELYKNVVAVKHYGEFFKFLNMSYRNVEQRGKELVKAMELSRSQGYH